MFQLGSYSIYLDPRRWKVVVHYMKSQTIQILSSATSLEMPAKVGILAWNLAVTKSGHFSLLVIILFVRYCATSSSRLAVKLLAVKSHQLPRSVLLLAVTKKNNYNSS